MPTEIETDLDTGNIKWQHYALNVSPQLIEILNKAIQVSLEDRYTNAQEMLQALGASSTQISQPDIKVVCEAVDGADASARHGSTCPMLSFSMSLCLT